MGFKKLLASLGAGGASVETVLTEVNVVPGGVVQGEVRIQGGSVDQQIEGLAVGLQAQVEVEGADDQEHRQNIEFLKVPLGGAFKLLAGETHVGVTTELAIARAVDSSDLDPVNVHPLPAQKAIMDAFVRLGFRFKNADLERGHIRGTRQKLPFYQEIEFLPPQQYRGLNQVEVSFVADQSEMDVVLEMDKKPGLFSEGSDTFRSFKVNLHDYQATDWAAYLNQWLSEVGSRRNWF
jgi:sporulation-control protein